MVKTQGPQGWIAVDWDGTAVEYHGWTKWNEFGRDIPAMTERIKGWLAEGKDVRIFTARMPLPQDEMVEQTCYKTGEKFNGVMMKKAIADHCEAIYGHRLRVQCYKDLHTIEIWDDRAVGVVANTGQTLGDAAVAEYVALQGKAYRGGIASGGDGEAD
jgi:hypothetical protein